MSSTRRCPSWASHTPVQHHLYDIKAMIKLTETEIQNALISLEGWKM